MKQAREMLGIPEPVDTEGEIPAVKTVEDHEPVAVAPKKSTKRSKVEDEVL